MPTVMTRLAQTKAEAREKREREEGRKEQSEEAQNRKAEAEARAERAEEQDGNGKRPRTDGAPPLQVSTTSNTTPSADTIMSATTDDPTGMTGTDTPTQL